MEIKMNLQQGQVIKNYKELCSLLGLEIKGGKSKEIQIKDIERYCKLNRDGHKFIIEEVYEKPLPKVDGRVNNGTHIKTTKYGDLFDRILINSLIDYEGYIEESFSQMMSLLNIFTNKYEDLSKSGYKTFAEINGLGRGVTLTYQQKLNNIIKKSMETALNRLHKQGVIDYKKEINIRDENFKEYLADEQMKIKIKEIEQKTYITQDIKHYNRILLDVNRKFKNAVSKELGIMSYWNVYSIKLVDKNIDYGKEDKDELVIRLVDSIVDSVRNKKSTDEFGEKYNPYSYIKYDVQIDKLTRLLVKLPSDYKTKTERNNELRDFFNNKTKEVNNEDDILDECENFNIDDFYNYNQAIPF